MAESELRARGVAETTLSCIDLDAAEAFYTSVLGLEVYAKEEGRHVFFRFADGMFLLFNPEHTSTTVTEVAGTPIPLHGTSGAGHVAFRATAAEIDRWKRHLADRGVAVEAEVRWPQGGRSIYFRDPAGNSLEFITPETWGLPPRE